MTTTPAPRYLVLESAAKMPATCWGSYRRLAVVETDGTGNTPKMISERARHLVRIVRTWERCHQGKTSKSAAAVARQEAEELAAALNAGEPAAVA